MSRRHRRQVNLRYNSERSEVDVLRDDAATEVYNMEDGSGDIIIDRDYLHVEAHARIAFSLRHYNYLPPRFLNTEEGDEHSAYENFDCYMKEDIGADYTELIKPIPREDNLGEQYSYHFVHPKLKVFLRSMLDFVEYMHSKNVCFHRDFTINETNFVVIDEVLKFWRLKFERSTTITLKKRDYETLLKVIQTSLFEWENLSEQYFPALGSLFNLMSLPTYYPMLKNHLAVLLPHDRLEFIRNAKDKFKLLDPVDRTQLDNVYSNMPAGDYLGWITDFLYPHHCPYPELLRSLALEHCWDNETSDFFAYPGSPEFYNVIRRYYSDGNRNMKGRVTTAKRVHNILRMCRNLASHLVAVVGTQNEEVRSCYIDAIIMNTFGGFLLDVQVAMFSVGLLEKFMQF